MRSYFIAILCICALGSIGLVAQTRLNTCAWACGALEDDWGALMHFDIVDICSTRVYYQVTECEENGTVRTYLRIVRVEMDCPGSPPAMFINPGLYIEMFFQHLLGDDDPLGLADYGGLYQTLHLVVPMCQRVVFCNGLHRSQACGTGCCVHNFQRTETCYPAWQRLRGSNSYPCTSYPPDEMDPPAPCEAATEKIPCTDWCPRYYDGEQ